MLGLRCKNTPPFNMGGGFWRVKRKLKTFPFLTLHKSLPCRKAIKGSNLKPTSRADLETLSHVRAGKRRPSFSSSGKLLFPLLKPPPGLQIPCSRLAGVLNGLSQAALTLLSPLALLLRHSAGICDVPVCELLEGCTSSSLSRLGHAGALARLPGFCRRFFISFTSLLRPVLDSLGEQLFAQAAGLNSCSKVNFLSQRAAQDPLPSRHLLQGEFFKVSSPGSSQKQPV